MSYHRELEWNEPPSPDECRYARWTVVRAAGPAAPSWWPLARIGAVDLYLAPPDREHDAPTLSVTPLIAGKRGRRGSGDYPGVDGDAQTDAFEITDAGVAPARPYPFPPVVIDSDAIRVAVVDIAFDKVSALPSSVEGPMRIGLPRDDRDLKGARPAIAPGHGTAMAGVVLAQCPGARVGLFEIPAVAGAARPYLAPADLAAAIAAAAGAWAADVVLIAMSDGAWGTPRYLRDVLREAARCGRRGRGTSIVCSVGDPSRNHAREDDSAMLGADDLASQPWVHAVAACDARGRWYRVYQNYACPGPANRNAGNAGGGAVYSHTGNGATYNRLGPAVALSAPGEPRRWSAEIAADDSSQASAVVAGAAARVLQENRDLTAVELRALLALTADAPAAVDGGRGLAAGEFDARDRLGHNFKIGHGAVNAQAGCLAAADPMCLALLATRAVPDEVGAPHPDPLPGGEGTGTEERAESRALALARCWQSAVRRAGRRRNPVAREYLCLAGRVSRLFFTSLEVQEALCWLARHVRALAETADWGCWQTQHHGALVERIRHACEAARDALGAGDSALAARLRVLEAALADPGAGAAAATFLATAFRPAQLAPNGGPGEPRSTAFTKDAVGDRHRGRRLDHAHGGGQLERPAFERARVSGAVHRSPR